MQKELKFKIISECLSNGVSITCEKYSISRTIYYRWLQRYKAEGIDGLEDIKKDFIPRNKTAPEVEKSILDLVKIYPKYGPEALNYLLEELGYHISSSAVFNVLRRHKLTNKYNRIKFSKKKNDIKQRVLPAVSDLKSGEGWVFWITDLGGFKEHKNIYTYTLFDIKSRIACTRLYTDISFVNFEDILAAVALSVATTLNLKTSYLCFFSTDKIVHRYKASYKSKIAETLKKHDRDMKLDFLDGSKDYQKIYEYREEYTKALISVLMPLFSENKSLSQIKRILQNFVRDYNLNTKIKFEDDFCSPVDYHNRLTNTKPILPLWAYIDRDY